MNMNSSIAVGLRRNRLECRYGIWPPSMSRDRVRCSRRPAVLKPEYHEAYGVFLTICLFRSGEPSVHHTGPRSPSFRLATSTVLWAAVFATRSPASLADLTALRAAISSLTKVDRSVAERFGLASRQSLPRTTK